MRLHPPAPSSTTNTHVSDHPHSGPDVPQSSPSPDGDSEMDAEVDQLDSDTDMDETESASSTNKNGTAHGERVPGCSLLPTTRLENILQADGVTGNLALSKEALFVLSIATEEFIKRMAQAGQIHASAKRQNAVHYTDMAASTHQYQEFMFLKDTIPTPISLAEAMQLRQAKEKAMLEDDPALATFAHAPAAHPLQNGSATSRPKGKGRSMNGHENVNGKAGSGMRQERHFTDHRGSDGSRDNTTNGHLNPAWSNASNGDVSALSPGTMTPHVNGDVPALPTVPNSGTNTPHTPHDSRLGPHPTHHMLHPLPDTLPNAPEDTWPRGPGLVNADHLGRTIYSKDQHEG
ncbi:hypothetical protein AX17_005308 [Amanita inopinata Kibby_2008]|nr:hypothetical protein AX17_005308 [Amanita inopinata Kibby_2008]